MVAKYFCDLCGNPAMNNAIAHLTLHRAPNCPGNNVQSAVFARTGQPTPKYHVTVEFTVASKPYPRTGDDRGDICNSCLAEAAESIARSLKNRPKMRAGGEISLDSA